MQKAPFFCLLFFLTGLLTSVSVAKSTEVRISAPLRPKFVAKGCKKIYIADFFVTGEHNFDPVVNINVNKEVKETLISEFKDRSGYQIESLKIEIAKDQKPEEVLKNPSFWMSQDIKDKEGSLILTGAIEFSNYQKSGLVTQRVTDPRTGNERTITSSRERLQLVLALEAYIIDAQSGEKLYQEQLKEEQVYDDVSNVSLPLFYDVFDRIAPKVVGILVPYRVAGSRTLLEP